MPGTVRVEGLHELQAAFAKADRQLRLGVRGELRQVAEPIRLGAEQLAPSTSSRIGPRWTKMRVGISRDLVYVAPRQRGRRGAAPTEARHRADQAFATRLMDRAMEPSLERHTAEIENRFEGFLDRIADYFNEGGL